MCLREQRQKDPVKMAANSFPRDMDYRQEALQDKASTSKCGRNVKAKQCGSGFEIVVRSSIVTSFFC